MRNPKVENSVLETYLIQELDNLKEILDYPCSEVHLEVGCGNGMFTAKLAHFNPQNLVLACELDFKRVKKTIKRFDKQNLTNGKIFHGKGEDLLAFLPSCSLDAFYLNFPDPWPKKKHHKRRFFHPQENLLTVIDKLKPHGKLYFVSDHEEYFFFTLEERLKKNQTIVSALQKDYDFSLPNYFSTYYEDKFKAIGKKIYYACFKKI